MTVGLVDNWYPPSKENYDFVLSLWKWYPVFCSLQWGVSWYGMGKTSGQSRLNVPGRIGWLTMEVPGFLSLLYTMTTLPAQLSSSPLPWQNKVLGALFVIHYTYRAVLFPLLQPSISPMHIIIWASAFTFQVINGTLIGSYLSGYGPSTPSQWATALSPLPTAQFALGLALFSIGLAGNYYHDEELRSIRRREQARQERIAREKGGTAKSAEKHYEIPQAGLFSIMLFPHYFMEWIEWLGFWIAAGFACTPARCFFVNEVAAMLPRAVNGKKWYVEKFGKEKIEKKWAAIPGVW